MLRTFAPPPAVQMRLPHLLLSVLSLSLPYSFAVEDLLQVFRDQILSDLGMEKFPDMKEVNTSAHTMRKMTREYLRRVSRSQRVTHYPQACTDDSVTFHPDDLSHPSEIHSSLLHFPNTTTSTPIPSDSALWRWNSPSSPTLVAPCADRGSCCGARLEVVERAARNKRSVAPPCGRSSCCRRSLKVNFKELGWDWVIQPLEFEAFFCSGRCKGAGLGGAEVASNHALVQAILNRKHESGPPRPCCAPTRLRPLDLLHYDDKNELVVSRKKDMIVRKCACT